jgi:hypothetical protein
MHAHMVVKTIQETTRPVNIANIPFWQGKQQDDLHEYTDLHPHPSELLQGLL